MLKQLQEELNAELDEVIPQISARENMLMQQLYESECNNYNENDDDNSSLFFDELRSRQDATGHIGFTCTDAESDICA